MKLISDEIDFSSDFEIETDRYTLVKKRDWIVNQAIGRVLSVPTRAFFWDWEVARGPDADRSRAALSILESEEGIDGLTVRLNHNSAWKDYHRLFAEDQLEERNPWFFRATIGSMDFLSEITAEFFRPDYYNPMTRTVVAYSNVESILSHEIGHHKDYQRFPFFRLKTLPQCFYLLHHVWRDE